MRVVLIALAVLSLTACVEAQTPQFRLGADLLLGNNGVEFAGGAGVTGLVRTSGAVGAYAALRSEATFATVGGEGYVTDVPPEFGGVPQASVCRSVVSGDEAPATACGDDAAFLSVGGEAGGRLGVGRGAALAGVGYRSGGAGRGAYAAVMAQFARPVYLRLEGGADHGMIGIGFGRF